MKAVLLAAGIGKRLQPITDSIPKPMIKIAGKPILEYILEDLYNFGFNDICIIIGHQGNQIKEYFDLWNKNNLKITFVTQNEYKGTAHATFSAKDFVKNDSFLLYLSDTIIPLNLENHLSQMINEQADVSILSSQIFLNNTQSVGNIEIENNYVTKIVEKSKLSRSNLAWAGVAFFNNNSIFKIIENLQPSESGELDITTAINLAIEQNKKIKNYSCEKFIDCGTCDGLLNGLKFILEHKCKSLSNNKISKELLKPSYIGTNCVLGDNVTIGPFVSIDNNVNIGNNVKINETIILSDTIIPSNQIIRKSIVLGETRLCSDE